MNDLDELGDTFSDGTTPEQMLIKITGVGCMEDTAITDLYFKKSEQAIVGSELNDR